MQKIKLLLSKITIFAIMRLASSISRFVFIFILAKTLENEGVEHYILISSTISYLALFLGVDYYTHSNRRINELYLSKQSVAKELNNARLVHVSAYTVLVIATGIACSLNPDLVSIILLASLIAILEHSTLEQYRLLNILDCQCEASILIFIKTALWMIPCTVILIFSSGNITLTKILMIWTVFLIIAFLISKNNLHRKLDYMPDYTCDINSLIRGIKNSAPFFISSIFFRILTVADKYLINIYDGENLIKYGLINSMCGGIALLFEIFIIFPNYANLMSSATRLESGEYQERYRKVWKEGLILSAMLVPVVIFSWFVFSRYLNMDFHAADLTMLTFILVATTASSISTIPNTGLYALHFDRVNIQANIICGVIFTATIFTLFGLKFLSGITIAASISLSYLALLIAKSLSHRKALRYV